MTHDPLIILGIETSCDETAAAVIKHHKDGSTEILSDIVYSQLEEHKQFGGVVPELAARAHVSITDKIVQSALDDAGLSSPAQLSAIAVTTEPGLTGGLLVGMMTAKAICISHDLPLIPVNHLEGHALSVRLSSQVAFPYLLLLMSGGHTQLLLVKDIGNYHRLGTTIDDAAGEAFDKTAKLLGLPQPGGPNIENMAKKGTDQAFNFPNPLKDRSTSDFSFSGLKTAVRAGAENLMPLSEQDQADLCASFQSTVARHLVAKTKTAMRSKDVHETNTLVLAGGVAANSQIRSAFNHLVQEEGWQMIVPPVKHCTDNGAMIALAGAEIIRFTGVPNQETAIALGARARSPLDKTPKGQRHGGGKKGPKA